ncbi:hypothetical protein MBR06_000127 [Klebsiella pneumoniae]|uniref:hypothetical protein n=1 Tax=Klebsiella pneumoniae TaxID=573 RepID=UPI000694B81E|nr:hypothetical protein [Klebsiella pneumoniae]EKU4310123.1 hypothetical protein [Klebsiella pneumoniae]EKV0197507.1 hypothetical protein [Klebsiella pneumoniae]EKV6232221.1 hypothetical protein [Klebsiella pneumoniae]EKV7481523.1 hypothetical protein [Klebsiella pneumoniae]EKX1046097.1 hypothetical protein [Klebsiella pneumoniae]
MTTDITELAQSLKAAANKVGAYYWQAKKISGDFYVIRKGSYSSQCGYCTYEPIAEIDHKPTRDYVAIASPANILALVEALEKAQQRNGELETYSKTAIEFREAARDKNRHLKLELEIAEKRIAELEDAEQKLCAANVTLDSRAELAERQLAEMVSRTVTIKFTPIPVEELGNVRDGKKHPYMFGAGYNAAVIHCESVIQQELDAKGIKWEAE